MNLRLLSFTSKFLLGAILFSSAASYSQTKYYDGETLVVKKEITAATRSQYIYVELPTPRGRVEKPVNEVTAESLSRYNFYYVCPETIGQPSWTVSRNENGNTDLPVLESNLSFNINYYISESIGKGWHWEFPERSIPSFVYDKGETYLNVEGNDAKSEIRLHGVMAIEGTGKSEQEKIEKCFLNMVNHYMFIK